jgi:hypothetical protein
MCVTAERYVPVCLFVCVCSDIRQYLLPEYALKGEEYASCDTFSFSITGRGSICF